MPIEEKGSGVIFVSAYSRIHSQNERFPLKRVDKCPRCSTLEFRTNSQVAKIENTPDPFSLTAD
ncbi:hypothetical protein RSW36_27520, partial [Escherichia coli]|uniref:hypothetical protein n=1 Tax=Escherichia coli TaxID=562 RepID=UPI0028E02C32